MNSVCLQELVADCLEPTCLDGHQSDTSNGTTIANESSPQELQTGSCPTPPSSLMCVSSYSPVQPSNTEELRTWLQQVSPASPSPLQGNDSEPTTSATCGQQQLIPFALYDHDMRSWKTCQLSLIPGISEPFSGIWPKAGLMFAGGCYRQRNWERRINEIGFGLWPTPRAREAGDYQYSRGDHSKKVLTLTGAVKMWPTPRASDATGGYCHHPENVRPGGPALKEIIHGQLNPTWVEWLMGWPLGWTDLQPLVMDRFQQWLEQYGNCSQQNESKWAAFTGATQ